MIFKSCRIILQYHPSLAALSLFIQIKRGYKHKSGVNLAGIYQKWDKNRPAGIESCYKWDTVIPSRQKFHLQESPSFWEKTKYILS